MGLPPRIARRTRSVRRDLSHRKLSSQDLRDHFLLANYRGPSEGCTVLTVKVEPSGAGYVATSEKELFKGIGVSDVELGFDGKIYLCDFGGGWSVNENGSIGSWNFPES